MFGRLLQRALPLSGIGANETTGISIYDWAKMYAPGAQVTYGGNAYQAFKIDTPGGGQQYYTSNPVIFAPAAIRIMLFSEARFQWQQMRNGRPGNLFGNPDLALLEEPWDGHTTRDLLAQAELDVFEFGNSYWVKNGEFLQRLDPSKVKLLTIKAHDDFSGYEIGDTLAGYGYVPDKDHVTIYEPKEVCHYKPHPDVNNRFLGMSWVSPCLPDIAVDEGLTGFKTATIQNGAALSVVVSLDATISPEQAEKFIKLFHQQHDGPHNAGKTLFIGGGADAKTVGQTFGDLTLQAMQNAGEIRVASCAGIPPQIVGFSEALKGSSLNKGNYSEARRRLADVTMRPLWGAFASSMQSLLTVPGGSRLWFDDRDIPFLREDLGDQASILAENAASILKLVQSGWEPDAAIEAVVTGDLNRLTGRHLGLYSVQLQPPLSGEMPPVDAPGEAKPQLVVPNGKTPIPVP